MVDALTIAIGLDRLKDYHSVVTIITYASTTISKQHFATSLARSMLFTTHTAYISFSTVRIIITEFDLDMLC
jgi:hypothetical protein